jgi:hypothetical protein
VASDLGIDVITSSVQSALSTFNSKRYLSTMDITVHRIKHREQMRNGSWAVAACGQVPETKVQPNVAVL